MSDVEAVYRTAQDLAVQGRQLTDLLLGERRQGDAAQPGQEIGHQPRFAVGPLALEGSLHGGQGPLAMRARLVEQFAAPPLDQQFQQVQGPLVDIGLCPAAGLGQVLDERIGGGFVADLLQDRSPRRLQ